MSEQALAGNGRSVLEFWNCRSGRWGSEAKRLPSQRAICPSLNDSPEWNWLLRINSEP